ncbi:MAG: sulfatase-like hydrolase/transferase [Desulfobacterales bacterium]|nr:sulfatase-like hydrolase/transferase [Desulfobacterales bacterium]
MHAVAGGPDDRAVPHAPRPADAGDLPQPHLRPADRRTDAAAAGAEGRGLPDMMVGKWHLGHADKKFWPQNRGFDHFYGNPVGEVDYFDQNARGSVDRQRNGKFFTEKGYYMTLIGDEAVRLIDKQDKNKPFFLYFARPLAPHAPYQATKADQDRYASTIKDPTRRTYAAMITSLDDQAYRRRAGEAGLAREDADHLQQRQRRPAARCLRAERTPRRSALRGGVKQESLLANNGILRGSKGSLYEGGVRTPTIFNWPAKLAVRRQRAPAHGGHHAHRLCPGRRQGELRQAARRQEHLGNGRRRQTVATRRHPGKRRSVPRRHHQGQVEAGEDRPVAGQDGAFRPDRRSAREERHRRAEPGGRPRSREPPHRLRQRAKDERVAEGAAGLPWRAGQDRLRSGLRHRRRRPREKTVLPKK